MIHRAILKPVDQIPLYHKCCTKKIQCLEYGQGKLMLVDPEVQGIMKPPHFCAYCKTPYPTIKFIRLVWWTLGMGTPGMNDAETRNDYEGADIAMIDIDEAPVTEEELQQCLQ